MVGRDVVHNSSFVDGMAIRGSVGEQQSHEVISDKLKLALGSMGDFDGGP